jgi:hypothetical protein
MWIVWYISILQPKYSCQTPGENSLLKVSVFFYNNPFIFNQRMSLCQILHMIQKWTWWLRMPILLVFRCYSEKPWTCLWHEEKGSGRGLSRVCASRINLWLICNCSKIRILVLLQISHSTDIERKYPPDTHTTPPQSQSGLKKLILRSLTLITDQGSYKLNLIYLNHKYFFFIFPWVDWESGLTIQKFSLFFRRTMN